MPRRHPTTRVAADPLQAVIATRFEALASRLDGARRERPGAIHQARVASRRLREAIPVVGAVAGRAAVRVAVRRVRRITRGLGPVREADVALDLLDEFAAGGVQIGAATAATRAHVLAIRSASIPAMHRALRPATIDGMAAAVTAVRRALDGADETWRELLAARIRGRAGDLRQAIEAAGLLFDSHALHAVRIAAKKLRYALELAGDLRAAAVSRPVARLKRLQDGLGRLHDLDVLAGYARAAGAQASRPVGAQISAFARLLDERCRAIHARYLGARPRLLDIARAAGRDIAPATMRRRSRAATARAPART